MKPITQKSGGFFKALQQFLITTTDSNVQYTSTMAIDTDYILISSYSSELICYWACQTSHRYIQEIKLSTLMRGGILYNQD